MAGELWPPIRLEVLEDPALDAIWIVGKPGGEIGCKCDPGQWPNGVGVRPLRGVQRIRSGLPTLRPRRGLPLPGIAGAISIGLLPLGALDNHR